MAEALPCSTERRRFLKSAAVFAMISGLVASYGTFASFAARFLYPAGRRKRAWLFVTDVRGMQVGGSLVYRSPEGQKIAIARQQRTGDVSDFIALSSTCPHLGCQVKWEGHRNRFVCPCHNGVFDPSGTAISGPPAETHQQLARFPLKIERGLLFIHVPVERLTGEPAGLIAAAPCKGPGHDPVLAERSRSRAA